MSKQLMNFDPFRELARFEPMRGFEDFFRGARKIAIS